MKRTSRFSFCYCNIQPTYSKFFTAVFQAWFSFLLNKQQQLFCRNSSVPSEIYFREYQLPLHSIFTVSHECYSNDETIQIFLIFLIQSCNTLWAHELKFLLIYYIYFWLYVFYSMHILVKRGLYLFNALKVETFLIKWKIR
jgi:hypothetical protein